ncbi:hypothetical protein ACFW2D_33860 [Streptomyces sp. NPDC058914]|uniref:hypothetical protein n=1 Tax=Streptomyces TaxID=1883 RepID=UPI003689405B
MPHVTTHRRTARLIDHAAPPTPQEWLENDARYFEDIEAEIERRAAGGDPGEAPWNSPLYFDTARDPSAARSALLALRHLPGGAIVRLVLDRLLHGESVRSRTGPRPARHEDTDGDAPGHRTPDGRTHRTDGTAGPPPRGGRAVVTQPASAEALVG